MFRSLLKFALLIAVFMASYDAQAQTVTTEQVIQQLESSGALDKAVQRSLERIRQKNIQAQKLEEEKAEKQRKELAKNARKVDPATEFIYGNLAAPISIIEYSDLECPYCQRFSGVPLELANQMPDAVNVVWRNFPLPFHNPMATIEASAAICVGKLGGNASFWKFAQLVFQSTKLNGQGMPSEKGDEPNLKLAKSLGINPDQFESCISSEAVQLQIRADIQDGVGAGINGTPGVILVNHQNGKVDVLAGAVPIETLKEVVHSLMAK